jgi:hypothetical protein
MEPFDKGNETVKDQHSGIHRNPRVYDWSNHDFTQPGPDLREGGKDVAKPGKCWNPADDNRKPEVRRGNIR